MSRSKAFIKRKGRKVIGIFVSLDRKIMTNYSNRLQFTPLKVGNKISKKNIMEIDISNFNNFTGSKKKNYQEKIYSVIRTLVIRVSKPVQKRV